MMETAIKYSKSKILVVLGPTSTGKTDLAISLAKKFNGELISCDSRQVYTGLDIGTGKAPSGISNFQFPIFKKEKHWEVDGIEIWMYDLVNSKRQYTVYDYVQDASGIIGQIQERKKLPIVVGGTGLYLKALLYRLPNLGVPVDPKLRKGLKKLSLQELQDRLKELSPNKWEKMNNSDRRNPRRLVRVIEVVTLDSKGKASSMVTEDSSPSSWRAQNDLLKIGLTAPREVLYQRIDERVISRIDQGMITEAENLHKEGLSFKRMKQLGLEYGVLANYLSGKIKYEEELIKILQNKIHGFARRQKTWFKKEKNIHWFDITDKKYLSKVEKLVARWYDRSYAAKD